MQRKNAKVAEEKAKPRSGALAEVTAASAADASPRKKAEVDENCFLYEALARDSGEISGAATTAF
jgi:hypothetical protein